MKEKGKARKHKHGLLEEQDHPVSKKRSRASKQHQEQEQEKGKAQKDKHGFLEEQDHPVSKKRSRAPKQHQEQEQLISSAMSSKILKEALLQQKEIEDETKAEDPFSAIAANRGRVDDDGDSAAEDIDDFGGFSETLSQYNGFDDEVDEEEEKILEVFMSRDAGPQRTLADLIISRIREKEETISSEARPLPKLNNDIINFYKGIGKLLSKYTTGKLPKGFKHIPSIEVWEDVLYLTEPENWSPNAMYQATRIFASNMGTKKAQRFYNLVLLPRVRHDIERNKRLHFALYQSLKKSLYKPAAFNKGILFPLCESRTCTLREAVIMGSIIQKVSIPPLHSSVALLKLAEMEYCGTTSYFIKLFLDKKYALPYRVLDAVVSHFMKFVEDARMMPVIWHQSLLTFVQRYKNELTKDEKDSLDLLIQSQKHYLVTPEIKRELKNSRNRGEKEDPMSLTSPASVINKAIEEDRFNIPHVPMEED